MRLPMATGPAITWNVKKRTEIAPRAICGLSFGKYATALALILIKTGLIILVIAHLNKVRPSVFACPLSGYVSSFKSPHAIIKVSHQGAAH